MSVLVFRFASCLVLLLNKVDLMLAFFQLLVMAAAPVAGEMTTGVGRQLRSGVVPTSLWKDFLRCVLQAGNLHGGGHGVEDEWSFWSRLFGRCTSSSTEKPELRRLPKIGGRWAVSAVSVTLLVEGRPYRATAHDARSSSSSRREATREAVMHWCRARFFLLRRREAAGRWSNEAKWFVPGGGWTVSAMLWLFGPDCVFRTYMGSFLQNQGTGLYFLFFRVLL